MNKGTLAGALAVMLGAGVPALAQTSTFAPTNEAFAKIPSATLTAVGNDKAVLTKVLTYHVIAGKLDSAAIAADQSRRRNGDAEDRRR